MKNIITLFGIVLILSFGVQLFANDNVPYISLGIQLGYGFDDGLFLGNQITFGVCLASFSGDPIIAPGISFGIRKYKGLDKIFMRYVDFQIATILGGLGVGHTDIKSISTNRLSKGYRVKGWAGLLGYATYDFFKVPDNDKKHNIGLIGVIPIPLGDIFDWYFM